MATNSDQGTAVWADDALIDIVEVLQVHLVVLYWILLNVLLIAVNPEAAHLVSDQHAVVHDLDHRP